MKDQVDNKDRAESKGKLTRRQLLQAAGATALGAALGGTYLAWLRHERGQKAGVFVGKAATYDEDLAARILEGFQTLGIDRDRVSGKRILLKPNLVETAKGYMQHERGTLEAVTKARSQAMDAGSVAEAAKAEGQLTQALSKLMLLVENYPDLKANQNFLSVQEELTSTENKIAFARQSYNDQVLFFNNKIQMFPSNIVAGMFSFGKRDFFEIEEAAEKEAPKVSFS